MSEAWRNRVSRITRKTVLPIMLLKTMVIYFVVVETAFAVLVAAGCGLVLALAGICSS